MVYVSVEDFFEKAGACCILTRQEEVECAKQMNLVRTSVTGIYARARQKIADSLVNGKELWIEGGSYEVCEGGLESCPSRKESEKCSQCSKEHTGSR